MSHPSFLELDRLALGEASATTRSHVEACPRCSAHVARVDMPVALPAWVAEVDTPRRPWRLRWLGGFVAAGAAAAAAVAILAPADRPAYVAAKGMPSVAVYVLRDGHTALWNGSDALHPGDRIRLKVAPEGYRWVAVSAFAPDGTQRLLHAAALDPAGDYLLPESFRLDAAPGPERLHIALDARAVDPARAAWRTTLEIPKDASR